MAIRNELQRDQKIEASTWPYHKIAQTMYRILLLMVLLNWESSQRFGWDQS
jgi:hypothetical protein